VAGVAAGLGALVHLDGVLDRVPVQAELVGETVEQGGIGRAEVGPDQHVVLLEVVRDVVEREVLGLENSVSPDPCAYIPNGHLTSLTCLSMRITLRRA